MLTFFSERIMRTDLRFRAMRLRMLIRDLSGLGYRPSAMVSAATRLPSAFW